jgi:hypothetical protein
MLPYRQGGDSASRTEALWGFPLAKGTPKPFFDHGGQGGRIISVEDLVAKYLNQMRIFSNKPHKPKLKIKMNIIILKLA